MNKNILRNSVVTKLLLAVAICGAAIVFFVPFMSRALLTHYALATAEDVLQMKVSISSAELRLLNASVRINDIAVYHPVRMDETFIKAKHVDVRMRIAPLFIGRNPSLAIAIDKPELVYATDPQGDWELKDKVPLFRRGTGEKRLPFDVERIRIDDGSVVYRDGRAGKTTKLSDIKLDVKRVQLPREGDPLPAKFDLKFMIDGAAYVTMEGRADFLSPTISFDANIAMKGLPLPPFAPYYDSASMPVRITHGSAAMKSHARCDKDYLNAPAHMTITALKVQPKKAAVLGFAADRVVQGLKDKNGRLEIDVMISGNIRNPSFHVLNDFSRAFSGSFAKGLVRDVPDKIGETGKRAGSRIKRLFGR